MSQIEFHKSLASYPGKPGDECVANIDARVQTMQLKMYLPQQSNYINSHGLLPWTALHPFEYKFGQVQVYLDGQIYTLPVEHVQVADEQSAVANAKEYYVQQARFKERPLDRFRWENGWDTTQTDPNKWWPGDGGMWADYLDMVTVHSDTDEQVAVYQGDTVHFEDRSLTVLHIYHENATRDPNENGPEIYGKGVATCGNHEVMVLGTGQYIQDREKTITIKGRDLHNVAFFQSGPIHRLEQLPDDQLQRLTNLEAFLYMYEELFCSREIDRLVRKEMRNSSVTLTDTVWSLAELYYIMYQQRTNQNREPQHIVAQASPFILGFVPSGERMSIPGKVPSETQVAPLLFRGVTADNIPIMQTVRNTFLQSLNPFAGVK